MNAPNFLPLIVGEVLVDVTITPRGQENKLRFGGIVHAARGFWASDIPYGVAAYIPKYLERSAREYLAEFGCKKFVVLGYVSGAPNVTLIFDPTEVDDQEYDILLRDEKTIDLVSGIPASEFSSYTDALIIPGSYDLSALKLLDKGTRLHIDVAYDVRDVADLSNLAGPISTIFLSTSSELFRRTNKGNLEGLANEFVSLHPEVFVLKENRGGSRAYVYSDGNVLFVPAQLTGDTFNSVGVGDVYDAAFVRYLQQGVEVACWRATTTSSAYAQTTEPALFREYVRRSALLTISELQDLGGALLPWEERQNLAIYLAAPDFSNVDRREIDRSISALRYHNFNVRRPVQENGELPPNSSQSVLNETYHKDAELLKSCDLVFAVPTDRDPGTLVEIGLAIEREIPVVVYDPSGQSSNTMVMGGSACYSQNLGICLNAVFSILGSRSVEKSHE